MTSSFQFGDPSNEELAVERCATLSSIASNNFLDGTVDLTSIIIQLKFVQVKIKGMPDFTKYNAGFVAIPIHPEQIISSRKASSSLPVRKFRSVKHSYLNHNVVAALGD